MGRWQLAEPTTDLTHPLTPHFHTCHWPSLPHSLTHSHTHSLTHTLTHTLTLPLSSKRHSIHSGQTTCFAAVTRSLARFPSLSRNSLACPGKLNLHRRKGNGRGHENFRGMVGRSNLAAQKESGSMLLLTSRLARLRSQAAQLILKNARTRSSLGGGCVLAVLRRKAARCVAMKEIHVAASGWLAQGTQRLATAQTCNKHTLTTTATLTYSLTHSFNSHTRSPIRPAPARGHDWLKTLERCEK